MADYLDCIHRLPGQQVHDGMYLPERLKPETLERIKTYTFRQDDVIISAYPKSGTVWMSQIVWSILHYEELSLNHSQKLTDRVTYLELSKEQGKVGMDMAEEDPSPRTIITHVPYRYLKPQFQGCGDHPKMIYILRDIKDVLASYYNFYRMADFFGYFKGTFDEYFELFRHKRLVYGDWFDHVKEYILDIDNPDIYFIRYEDLKTDLRKEIRNISNFLGKDLSPFIISNIAQDAEFDVMKSNPMANKLDNPKMDATISPFFRKGIVGDGHRYLSVEQCRYIENVYEETFTYVDNSFLQYGQRMASSHHSPLPIPR